MFLPGRVFDPAKTWNLSFDGSNDYVDCGVAGSNDASDPLFVSCMVNPASTFDAFKVFVSRHSIGTNYGGWALRNGGSSNRRGLAFLWLNSYGKPGSGQMSLDDIFTANTPVVIAATYTGNKSYTGIKLYVNGVQISSTHYITYVLDWSGTNCTDIDSTIKLSIGVREDDSSGPVDGEISNVIVMQRVPSDAEIKWMAEHYLTGREKDLIAYYPFLDKTGSTLKDWSNNGHDGTIYGATWQKGL